MPALINFVNVVTDAGALMVAQGADFLSVFDQPQRNALVMLFLQLHHHQITAAEILWGLWLFPMGALAYRSGFVPRFIGVWPFLYGAGPPVVGPTRAFFPAYPGKAIMISFPAPAAPPQDTPTPTHPR